MNVNASASGLPRPMGIGQISKSQVMKSRSDQLVSNHLCFKCSQTRAGVHVKLLWDSERCKV